MPLVQRRVWRIAGTVAILVPADASEPETAIVSDLFADMFRRNSHIQDVRESPVWVETTTLDTANSQLSATDLISSNWKSSGRKPGFQRPTTFDPIVCYQHLSNALEEGGLSRGQIGFVGDALAVSAADVFRRAFPQSNLVDASEAIARIKMVKSKNEIRNLRQAVQLAEHGIAALLRAIAAGVTRNDLALS